MDEQACKPASEPDEQASERHDEMKGDQTTAGQSGNDLASQLEARERELADSKDRYMRLYAEFENYKKRSQRDQLDYTKYATEKVIKDLLPVIDNLERAVSHAKSSHADAAIVGGLDLIVRQFRDALVKSGVEPIEALGRAFDPAVHEALAQVETGDQEPDTVVEEAQRGYLLHGRVLRPSLVTVAKAPAQRS